MILDPDHHPPVRAREFLPLTQLSFLVLVVLADRDSHGYGLLKEIERRTGGALTPATGTLYVALKRLAGDGLIAESSSRPDIGDDQRRRYYGLTYLGREVVRLEAERLAAMVALAEESELLPGTSSAPPTFPSDRQ